jgi:hypothetical protein
MLVNDLIDRKINALISMKNITLDETNEDDLLTYIEMRDFAKEHNGLLFFIGNEYYLVLNIVGEEDFLIILTENTI